MLKEKNNSWFALMAALSFVALTIYLLLQDSTAIGPL